MLKLSVYYYYCPEATQQQQDYKQQTLCWEKKTAVAQRKQLTY